MSATIPRQIENAQVRTWVQEDAQKRALRKGSFTGWPMPEWPRGVTRSGTSSAQSGVSRMRPWFGQEGDPA